MLVVLLGTCPYVGRVSTMAHGDSKVKAFREICDKSFDDFQKSTLMLKQEKSTLMLGQLLMKVKHFRRMKCTTKAVRFNSYAHLSFMGGVLLKVDIRQMKQCVHF